MLSTANYFVRFLTSVRLATRDESNNPTEIAKEIMSAILDHVSSIGERSEEFIPESSDNKGENRD